MLLRVRYALHAPLLALVLAGGAIAMSIALVGCDSNDDTEEQGLIRFDGVFVAPNVQANGAVRSADASSRGGCCYRFTLDIANDAGGVISGTGTAHELNQDGTDAGRNWAVDVSGTTEGDRVVVEMPTEDDFPTASFEGTVSEGADTIAGTFTSQFLDGQPVVFERVP